MKTRFIIWKLMVTFMLRSIYPGVPTGREAGWAPKSTWTLWSREEFLAPAGNWTPTIQLCRYTNWAILAHLDTRTYMTSLLHVIFIYFLQGMNPNHYGHVSSDICIVTIEINCRKPDWVKVTVLDTCLSCGPLSGTMKNTCSFTCQPLFPFCVKVGYKKCPN
jgi:hypothetical protein